MWKAKGRLVSLLSACLAAVLTLVLGVATMNVQPKTASAETVEKTYTFSNYTAGKQYAKNEEHKLDDYITITTNDCHFTTQLRIYSSSENNGYAIIKSTDSIITGISFNAGNKVDTLNVSKSSDGTNWTLIEGIAVTSKYKDYTVSEAFETSWLKLDVKGTNQVRLQSITLTFDTVEGGCEHVNQTTTTVDATCTEAGSITVKCDDCGETISTEEIPAKGHSIEEGEPVNNEDGTHSKTGICSACGKEETATEECTFDRVENEDNVVYTCSVCGYSKEVVKYEVKYVVPSGIAAVDSVKVEQDKTVTFSAAETAEGYTFVGWTTAEYEAKTGAPETIYEVGEEFSVTEAVTFYALYTYTEGSGNWELVTDVNTLHVNAQIVIAASGSNYALGTNQKSNNREAVSIEKGNDTVTIGDTVQIITLENGTVDDTWAFNVGSGYLYAASSGNNYLRTQTTNDANGSWSITITAAGVATIKAQGSNTRNLLKKNSNDALFSCYGSGQNDVSIYMKSGNTYYTTSFASCQHTNVTEETTDATCTATGLTKTVCIDCGAITAEEEIPALGHNYVGDFCENCGEQDPATIDYSGYYYISFTHGETVYYADNSELNSNRYYAITEQPSVEPVAAKYVYRLVKTGMNEQLGVYSLYEVDGDCYQENVIVEKEGDVYHFYATVGEDECQFLLNAGSTTKYIKFYKKSNATQSNYAQDITLTPVEVANIKSASVTLSDNIEVNYYATISDAFVGDVVMQYTVGDEGVVYDTEGVKQEDGRYKFTFKLPPQYMADVIDLKIVYDDFVLDSMEYSIKTYAQNQLNNTPSDKLKQLLTDMLHYGAAAQVYKGHNLENLATSGVEKLGAASTATPEEPDFDTKPISNTEITSYPAYFTGATVWFDNVNRIRVKINTTANVTLTINNVEVEVTGTTVDTEGILATEFDKEYTFVLYHEGVLMQTLTYSINAYAYAKKDDAKMSELALALYNYGISANEYKASISV